MLADQCTEHDIQGSKECTVRKTSSGWARSATGVPINACSHAAVPATCERLPGGGTTAW
jgi:hypothetical protein